MAQTLNAITTYVDSAFSDLSLIKYGHGFMSIWANSGLGSKTVFVENATQIVVDIMRGKKTIPKVLSRSAVDGGMNLGGNARMWDGEKFQNVAYDFPIISDWSKVTYDQAIKNRMFGQLNTDTSTDVMMKARELLMHEILPLVKGCAGKMEAMFAEAICSGTVTLDDGQSYSFDRSPDLTFTPLTLWSVTATASPIGDIDDLIDVGKEKGRVPFDAFLFGYGAWKAMLNTDEIKAANSEDAGFEFLQMGNKTPLPALPAHLRFMEPAGFSYMGYLITYKGRKVYCFLYDEEYENASAVSTPYMTTNNVLGFSAEARRDKYIGPPIRFPIQTADEMMLNRVLGIEALHNTAVNEAAPTNVLDARMFHHDIFLSQDKTAITVNTYTGPLPVPTQVDASGLLEAVIAA